MTMSINLKKIIY